MSSPVPVKSQQLHNFSLPQLKWNKKHTTNLHRRRRATDSPPPLPHRSPIRDPESDHPKDDVEKSDKDQKAKIYIRIKKASKAAESVEEDEKRLVDDDQVSKKDEIQGEKEGVVENCENEEVEEPKIWNLRPRRVAKKGMNVENSGTMNIGSSNGGDGKEKKQKFSVSLTREEIEDDFLVMTGARPPRRPKKRAKTVQRQLNNVFPGLWLGSVTPDCYKVPDPPMKG